MAAACCRPRGASERCSQLPRRYLTRCAGLSSPSGIVEGGGMPMGRWMMVVAITACATPYQAKGFAGGYSDYPVGNNSYAISVDVNSYTSMSTAMEYAYRRASELCPRGYDVVDRAGSQSDFYIRNGNVLQNMPKSSVSLIVTCGVQVRPAAIRPAAIRHDDSAWWCTATDAGMDYCERTMAACEDFRAG